jgi:hypothetical protein
MWHKGRRSRQIGLPTLNFTVFNALCGLLRQEPTGRQTVAKALLRLAKAG